MCTYRGRWPRIPLHRVPQLLLVLAAATLAFDPMSWLVRTWRDPAYDSHGVLVAAAVAAIALWSGTSRGWCARGKKSRRAFVLLGASAGARLIGQVGAVNVLGALTLVADVYAIGVLLQLDRRRRPVAPGWLALAFAFALPIERILQRCIGYVLQEASAAGACAVLGSLYDDVRCAGVRIVIDGRDVLVDLPCSGARTLMLAGLGFALAAAVARPSRSQAAAGAALTLMAAGAANVLRIVVLAVGIAHPESLGGIDVMAAPWHGVIGLAALALAFIALAAWARHIEVSRPQEAPAARLNFIPHRLRSDSWWVEAATSKRVDLKAVGLAAAALAGAVVIVNLPRRPIDAARQDASLAVPATIAGVAAAGVALTPLEQAYFTQYGGAAVKASYGAHNLLMVRTTSPLRHLHAPDECLRGIGFAVTYLGMDFAQVPTARYVATSPGGQSFRIDVTFVSERGYVTGSVADAVWHWLNGAGGRWTAIQRISPGDIPGSAQAAFSLSALAALGIEPLQSNDLQR